MRRALIASALLCSLAFAQPGRRALTLPLTFSVAQADDQPVVDEAWIADEIANANSLYEPHGLRFQLRQQRAMSSSHAHLETREDRHALASLMRPGVINVFIVASLRDVDDPSRYRQGVHWRPRGTQVPAESHFVVVSAIAGPTVLAHELGHFFGNPHSQVPGNLMSYDRGEGPPVLDAIQVRRAREHARTFVESGELVPIARPRAQGR